MRQNTSAHPRLTPWPPHLRREYAVFYAGSAPTHARQGGVLCMSNNDPSKPILWFHGPRKTGVIGGESWAQDGSACAFPTSGKKLNCNQRMLEAQVSAGYKSSWGYVKLVPVAFVD